MNVCSRGKRVWSIITTPASVHWMVSTMSYLTNIRRILMNQCKGGFPMKLTIVMILGLVSTHIAFADDADRLLRLDHYVQVRSTVPAIAGQITQIYVREVVEAGTVPRSGPARGRRASVN